MLSSTRELTDMSEKQPVKKWPFAVFAVIGLGLVWVSKHGLPISIGIDPHQEHCLTHFHAGLLIKIPPQHISRNELVIFKPFGALSYVRQPYVMKEVAGVPGDRLVISNGMVTINGHVVVSGMPLLGYYHQISVASLNRNETIPAHHYFVIGDHPRSDDSRYWGYLQEPQILGHAIAIY